MIRRIVVEGRPLKTAAAEFGLSERWTREWLRRYRTPGIDGLESRPSRPQTIANKIMAYQVRGIERLRRERRLRGAEIGEKLGLVRLGLGRLACLDPKSPVQR